MNAFDQAAALCEQRKIELGHAQSALLDAEQKMLALMPSKSEGSVTELGVRYKVTAEFGINRTLDAAALDAVRSGLPADVVERVITYKPSLVMAPLRDLVRNSPEHYLVLAQAITSKPAKPSIKVEAMQELKEAA